MPNQFRIISGKWRGRKLRFTGQKGLRPSLDRVRETLFNWLQGKLAEKTVLDLFAGSGALGFEAASRYARQVYLVEKNRVTVQQLHSNRQLLQTEGIRIYHHSAQNFLRAKAVDKNWHHFINIVFIDPPFHQNLLNPICAQLQESQILAKSSWIYLETEKQQTPSVPDNWQLKKSAQVGQVAFFLYQTTEDG